MLLAGIIVTAYFAWAGLLFLIAQQAMGTKLAAAVAAAAYVSGIPGKLTVYAHFA